ncbi:MAG TPA: TonB family protein [Candidatus Aquilonibacter sp.]|nr:TonB family protein [Candidatus Aquilonibacter sp.]
MPSGGPAPSQNQPSQRRVSRYQVQAPLDVTVLRQGIPHTLPGRSLNLCERGIAAVLAGEVLPGEAVGLEIQLPRTSSPLRARALIRHHDRLRCGMEFMGLTAEQQVLLHQWVEQAKVEQAKAQPEKAKVRQTSDKVTAGPVRSSALPKQPGMARRRNHIWGWALLLVLSASVAGMFWWRWNRGWQEIEASVGGEQTAPEEPQVQVPSQVMEKLITHRVDPEYPEAARAGKLEGVVVLDVVVGRDGSVVGVRPVSGLEIFAKPAADALRWWRFEPYRINGEPVPVETTVAVEFNP